jgi:phosphomannomutase
VTPAAAPGPAPTAGRARRLDPRLAARARAWIADDPDPDTRAELEQLLATGAAAELAERMAGPLRFGTAGLRGPVRAGPNGMNVAVVRRTTAGLAAWLAGQRQAGGTVVVGRDARHGSHVFAAATAGVLAAAGFDVRTLPGPLPTPVLAHAVRALPAVAGVQITASHNPAADNGYKVYLGFGGHGGAQLVAPADSEIEAAIDAAPPAAQIAVAAPIPAAQIAVAAAAAGRPHDPTGRPYEPLPGYLERVGRLPRGTARRLRIALTPLHGVGGAVAQDAFHAAGFTDVHLVAEQADPDPDFPTVDSPNPEDPRSTAALLVLAAEIGADLAIALDPDADRCAVGIPDRTESASESAGPGSPVPGRTGGWRMLTGDQVGALLGEHILRTGTGADPLVASTVVSSSLLAKIAAAHGARHAETLTGFKWIVRAGAGLVYGYEEAIGYCVDPDAVRDKDGIAAAVLIADLAAIRAATGGSLDTVLDELAVRHGVHATGALTWTMSPERIAAALERVNRLDGVERPAPDVLIARAAGQRIAVRPSGTEPKLKVYLEVVEPVPTPDALPAARLRAARRLAMLGTEITELIGGGPSPPC